jgi:hypothetical protein
MHPWCNHTIIMLSLKFAPTQFLPKLLAMFDPCPQRVPTRKDKGGIALFYVLMLKKLAKLHTPLRDYLG